jgi:uncharacterized membrane protein YdjX (TVP38/TMEM64 family)
MVAIMLTTVAFAPVTQWLTLGITWIEAHPALAWAVYIASYILATVLVVPALILTLAAGFVFGLPLGVALVSIGSVLGATTAFLVGRFLARDWVSQRISGLPRFQALDKATRTEGFLIVFLTRLSPLFPFNLINYGLALTSVRLRDYFFASWIGMLPGTILYVYIGSVAKNLADLSSGDVESGTIGRIFLFVGLAATLILTIVITRKATRTLSGHLGTDPTEARAVAALNTENKSEGKS